MTNTLGGWDFTHPQTVDDVDPHLVTLFEKTMSSLVGASYKILQLSGVQASARNYFFICEQTLVTCHLQKSYAAVTLHMEDTGDSATIVNIISIS